MDPGRFDALTRSLATPKSRRGFLAGTVAFAAAAASGLRGGAQNGCPPGQTPNRKGDCSCPAGTDPCPNGCFDRRRDVNNCGSCGNVCATGAVCVKGECRCPSGTVECESVCRTQASFADDPNNCGVCGNRCPAGSDPTTCEGRGGCSAGVCGFEPLRAGELCRPATDVCDVADFCDGLSLACPPDRVASVGVLCRPSTRVLRYSRVLRWRLEILPTR